MDEKSRLSTVTMTMKLTVIDEYIADLANYAFGHLWFHSQDMSLLSHLSERV
jgi:hypothetical protein